MHPTTRNQRSPAVSRRAPAFVLFAHGARDPRWSRTLAALAAALEHRHPGGTVRTAFLELQAPSLEQALDSLAAEGLDEIRIVPVFWAAGGHVNEDLPRMVAEARRRHPQLAIAVLPVLSELPGMLEFIADAVSAAAEAS